MMQEGDNFEEPKDSNLGEQPIEFKLPERKPENPVESQEESKERISAEQKEIKEAHKIVDDLLQKPENTEISRKLTKPDLEDYRRKNIPPYLRVKKENGTLLNRVLAFISKGKFEIAGEDRENIPKEGPFLVISNHFGGETPAALSLFGDKDVHIAAGEESNWKRSGTRALLLKSMRMISVPESLANLSDAQKQELLARVPGEARKNAYQRVIDNEKRGQISKQLKFLEESTALLSRGDVVVMYPEGLFAYEKKPSLRQAYRGIEIIAQRYKDLTGEELPIVPMAVFKESGSKKKRVRIGNPIKLNQNNTEIPDADYCMAHLAKLLPEEQRGYYKETAEII